MSEGPEAPAAAVPPVAAEAAQTTAAAPDASVIANEDGASQAPAPVASTSEAGAAPAPTAAPNTSAAPQEATAAASVAPVARADSANGTLKMSIKTEESAGAGDSASEDSSSNDSSSSDGSSSSSSEDPSVTPGDIENQGHQPPPMHLRKSPPESQGVCPNSPGSVVSDDQSAQAAAVLTKEELLALQDAAEATAQGHSFYRAYGDVAGEGAVPIDSSHRSRRTSRRGSKIGQDRASVRSMVAQRMVGKGYDRSGRMGAASRRGSGKRSVGASVNPVNRDIAAMADEMERFGPSSGGWTSAKKRRVLYALLAVAVTIVGISLIVYGVGKQQEYNQQDDEGADDSAVENAPSPSVPAPTLPTPPSTFAGLTAQPATGSPVMGSDDALLTLLKRGYADAFGMIEGDTSGLLAEAVGSLDHAAQSGLPADAQSVQWRVYDYMAHRRSDAIAKGTNALRMEDERILQIFALGVFYETFGWELEGEDECQWPGVACRGLGMHAEVDDVDPDNLRVVSLKVNGEAASAGEDGPYGPLLEGELPIELMFLRHLETLDLSHNLISGQLRGEMFHFKNMKALELNDNRLEGAIPPELGSMYNMQKLTLHHNEFTGTVPAEVCTLRVTRVLHFLWADCSPMPVTNVPKVDCPIENCCSICFEGYDADGGPSTGGSSPPTQGGKIDTPHNVQNDGGSSIKTKLSEASTDGGAALLDISSPQFRAYAWLVEDSNGSPGGYSDRRLLQRYALATLFDSTNGEHWARNDNWMTAADECEWFGISGCNGAEPDGIVSIELSENKLSGKIPPELFEFLPDIAKLNLATNALTGTVPTEIGLLNEVNILELAVNKLTGAIPTQLGDLPSLDHLFLQYNEFDRGQSMPEQVCNLRNAGSMTLLWADCREGQGSSVQCEPTCCTTCFEGGSDDLFGAHSANDVHGDEATTHADSDGEVLATLKKMAPDGGTSLDDSLSPQVKAYSWLVGVDGQLNGLSDVQLLQRYALATVYFSTSGHGWIKEEEWLTDADACEWEMVLECNADGMATKVDLSGNNLVGQIPVEITHLRSLELLDLTDNELYGPIPSEFGWFEDMEILRLGVNLLTGDIPAELGNLHTMHELYIHDNDFSEGASVPYEVCALRSVDGTGLTTLWADCAGDWPAVFCEESCCDECFDDESDFIPYGGHQTGFFSPKTPPPVFSGSATIVPGRGFPPTAAPALSAPTLPENPAFKADLLKHMTGFEENLSDPNSPAYQAYLWLANSKGFEELDEFRKRQRFGLAAFYKSTTPDYDWKVSNRWQTHQHECGWFGITCAVDDTVTEISLPRNRMSGSIPPEIALVGLGGKIGKLDLSGNHIGGELPEQLGTLTHLEVLDLRNNDFTGPIPPELGQLSMLKSLALHANELSGDMPSQVCSLAIGSGLVELMADCDPADPFSKVDCDIETCCTHCD